MPDGTGVVARGAESVRAVGLCRRCVGLCAHESDKVVTVKTHPAANRLDEVGVLHKTACHAVCCAAQVIVPRRSGSARAHTHRAAIYGPAEHHVSLHEQHKLSIVHDAVVEPVQHATRLVVGSVCVGHSTRRGISVVRMFVRFHQRQVARASPCIGIGALGEQAHDGGRVSVGVSNRVGQAKRLPIEVGAAAGRKDDGCLLYTVHCHSHVLVSPTVVVVVGFLGGHETPRSTHACNKKRFLSHTHRPRTTSRRTPPGGGADRGAAAHSPESFDRALVRRLVCATRPGGSSRVRARAS